jgi:hypothetical protein
MYVGGQITVAKKKKKERWTHEGQSQEEKQSCHVVCSGYEGNINMDFGEMRRSVDWIYLPEDRIKG